MQRQIPWHTMLTVDYTGNRVTHLSGYNHQPHQPAQSFGSAVWIAADGQHQLGGSDRRRASPLRMRTSPRSSAAAPRCYQSLKPFPQYSNVARAWDQAGTTYFSAFQIQADKHLSNNLNFLANIELPRLYDNLVTTVNKYNQQADWGEDTTGSFECKFAGTL